MRIEELFKFIKERHSIWRARFVRCEERPWTHDPILRDNRFCNVYRELDKQTIWFAENWRKTYEYDKDLWFASLVFRLVNLKETATLITPLPWDPENFTAALLRREDHGKVVYNNAYMISTHGVAKKKCYYLADSLSKIWEQRDTLRYRKDEFLYEFFERLHDQFDIGSFMAGQVIADCKYAQPWGKAPDWWSFAVAGPGSKRGMSRMFNLPLNYGWSAIEWKIHLENIHYELDKLLEENTMPKIHAQDVQNCLCEFDKYERVRLGQGRLRGKFKGI